VANGYNKLDKFKLLQLLEKAVKSEIDSIVNTLMERFEDEIIPYEDEDDPARPSLCREEFRQFLVDDLKENIKIVNNFVEIGVGDDKKLGFGDELDEDTTDCVKIIGTILQGISGNYVLVTSQMTKGPEGRFGGGFLLPLNQYKLEAVQKGWDPNKKIWAFSDFPGIPDFFSDLDLKEMVGRITEKFAEQLKKV
jgi:hypothetical protein